MGRLDLPDPYRDEDYLGGPMPTARGDSASRDGQMTIDECIRDAEQGIETMLVQEVRPGSKDHAGRTS